VCQTLKSGGVLHDLTEEKLSPSERYSYNYQGNGQVLDSTLVSPSLLGRVVKYEPVHIDSDYPDSDQVSDHDPAVTRIQYISSASECNITLIRTQLTLGSLYTSQDHGPSM
jgi:predicted extracellular nuclease